MLTFDKSGVFADSIGPEHGLPETEFLNETDANAKLCREIALAKREGTFPFADLPFRLESAERIAEFARQNRGRFKNFVHVGIGGSALGAVALFQALAHPYHNLIAAPRLFFLDNVDPEETSALLEMIDVKETLFSIVTKSGETTETLATFLPILQSLKERLGAGRRDHLVFTTDPNKGFLRSLAGEEKIESFEIPPGVGGRFSAMTAVGLLPAAFAGVDILQILAGAGSVDGLCSSEDPRANIAFQHALLHVLLDRCRGKTTTVLMPYASRLKSFAAWHVQLWAESLGKTADVGPTPLASVGTTDQHSLIQLYNEGPNNKVITFIEVERWRNDVPLPSLFQGEPPVADVQGKSLARVIAAAKKGTAEALRQNKRPTCTIKIPEVGPRPLGALMHFFQMATLYAGRLYGVDPFTQPGVELGKRLIRQHLKGDQT